VGETWTSLDDRSQTAPTQSFRDVSAKKEIAREKPVTNWPQAELMEFGVFKLTTIGVMCDATAVNVASHELMVWPLAHAVCGTNVWFY
jgi:hypothetical protein